MSDETSTRVAAMGRVTSFIRLCIGFVVLAIISTVVLVMLPFLWPFRVTRIKLCNLYGKTAGRAIVALAGVTPRVANRERLNGSMPAIYVCNHNSTLDAFLCVWLCPIGACGVFKKEIVHVPFYGWIAYFSGHLLIDRGNKGKAVDALKDVAALVKKEKLGIWIMRRHVPRVPQSDRAGLAGSRQRNLSQLPSERADRQR